MMLARFLPHIQKMTFSHREEKVIFNILNIVQNPEINPGRVTGMVAYTLISNPIPVNGYLTATNDYRDLPVFDIGYGNISAAKSMAGSGAERLL